MTLTEYVVHRAMEWFESGRPVVLVTITSIKGSSSQPLGSRMAVTDGGEYVGFVSGGCVETDVHEQAQQVLADSIARRLHYRQVKDSLFEIGLNCEGMIDVILEPMDQAVLDLLVDSDDSAHLLRHRDRQDGTVEVERIRVLDIEDSLVVVPEEVLLATTNARDSRSPVEIDSGDWHYLVEPAVRPPTLMIVSASSVAYPLCKLGKALGYRVVISDPRSDYLSADRFPEADALLVIWPRDLPQHVEFGTHCAVVSLNHEPRFEDDLFRTLQSQPPVGYIGAIGKRKRHSERVARQKEAGFDLSLLPTIHTPVGLDLGGRSAEQVALSIMAQIQAVVHDRPGGPLSGGEM